MGIWWEIIKENTRSAAEDIGLQPERRNPLVIALGLCIYIVLVLIAETVSNAELDLVERAAAYTAPILIFLAWWPFRLLKTIPQRERRYLGRIDRFRSALTPQLVFEARNGGRPLPFPEGTSTKLVSGDQVTNTRGQLKFICGVVGNPARTDVGVASAYLVELRGNNGSQMVDPISFSWHGSKYDGADSIPAGSQRTIKLFKVTENAIYMAADTVPFEYIHFFKDGTTFTGKLVINGYKVGDLVVHFVLHTDGDPRLEVVHTNTVQPNGAADVEDELPEGVNG